MIEYRAKSVVFSQGEMADSVFYIQNGSVRLSVVSQRGKEATVGLLGPGDLIGEACMAPGQSRRAFTVIATTVCSILRIEKSQMLRTMHEEPDFADAFVAYLIARNNRTQEDLIDQLFNPTERRLARALYLLGDFAKDRSEKVVPNVSQQTLADMIGSTRSRVNFFMNRFRKLGLIDYNGELLVRDSLLSVVLQE